MAEEDLYSILRTHDGRFLVGTEGARLAWVEPGEMRFIEAFDRVPERKLWDTPYGAPPELRSLALSTDGTIYANVHVGWIVRSTDGGRTWKSIRKGLDRDVHQVAAHPSDPKTVFAATANGFHISRDRGDAFVRRKRGMPYHYQRACACFPARDVYLASTARHDGGEDALLLRSEDEGRHWTQMRGLPPKINANINTHQIATLKNGHAFAVVEETTLYRTVDYGATWAKVRGDLPRIHGLVAP